MIHLNLFLKKKSICLSLSIIFLFLNQVQAFGQLSNDTIGNGTHSPNNIKSYNKLNIHKQDSDSLAKHRILVTKKEVDENGDSIIRYYYPPFDFGEIILSIHLSMPMLRKRHPLPPQPQILVQL